MSVRADLAAAASTVEGVTVTEKYRQTTKPGDGWVSLGGYNRDESGFSFMDTWEVRIVTPRDLAAADQWIEERGDLLLDALKELMIVLSLTPVTFQADAGNLPGLLISGVRPHPEGDEAR